SAHGPPGLRVRRAGVRRLERRQGLRGGQGALAGDGRTRADPRPDRPRRPHHLDLQGPRPRDRPPVRRGAPPRRPRLARGARRVLSRTGARGDTRAGSGDVIATTSPRAAGVRAFGAVVKPRITMLGVFTTAGGLWLAPGPA